MNSFTKRGSWSVVLSLLLMASAILSGCSGGGGTDAVSTTGTGTGSALQLAEKISVVDAKATPPGAAQLRIGKFKVAPSTVTAAGTDWTKDVTQVFVHERSAEVFDTINEIMCAIGQTQYDDMVNKGDYKAQIDMKKCSSSNDSASSAGQSSQNQSSGSTAPDYETWTINSYRADNSSPQIVVVWVHEEASGGGFEPEKRIYAKVTITEATSSTNPYGIFTLYFKSHPVINGAVDTSVTMFKGFMKTEKDTATGKILLQFITDGGFDANQPPDGINDFTFSQKVTLDRVIDGSSGSGTSSISDTFMDPVSNQSVSKSAQFNIAFNTSNFRRYNVNSTDDKCFSRTTFDETAWRYGLYDSTGTRVDINSGFPIKTSNNIYGWIGYYGMWFPESATINNGDTVYKLTYSQSGETATAYTVIQKGGKLKKYTKHTATLTDIKNIPMDGWMEGSTNYRVKWADTNSDGTADTFVKFAKQNTTTWMWENLPSETPIDLSTIQFGELNFWSQAIGGMVRVKLTCSDWNSITCKPICTAPSGTTNIIYFTEEVIFPGATVPATLRCYDNCPKYTAASSGISPSDPFQLPDYNPVDGPTPYNYTFNTAATDMLLKDSSVNSLVMTGSGSGQYSWGIMSGPMFDPTPANLALLACDWDLTQTCGWKAWGALDVFYQWETGPSQWNQFTALADSTGTPLSFSPPMQVLYTHLQTDITKPDYKYNDTKFYLEYSGFGNLHGIPGKCVNGDTGVAIDCGDATVDNQMKRWIAEFTIPDGSELSNSVTSATKYFAKALEKEQRMSNVAASNCSALTLTNYTLPVITDWVDPAIGTEPTVTNAPAVIGGVVQ